MLQSMQTKLRIRRCLFGAGAQELKRKRKAAPKPKPSQRLPKAKLAPNLLKLKQAPVRVLVAAQAPAQALLKVQVHNLLLKSELCGKQTFFAGCLTVDAIWKHSTLL